VKRAIALPAVLRAAPLILALVLLAVVPFVFGRYGTDLAVKVMIYAIFVAGLDLLVGRTGLVSLGHAAFFGMAAYVAVLASPADAPASLHVLLPLAVLAAAGFALVTGALALRTQGVYFIMVTLAFAQMAYYLFHDTPLGGGTDGIYMNLKPATGVLDLDRAPVFYGFCLVVLVATLAGLALLNRSRFGCVLAGIKASEQRMRALGFNTFAYKLAAYVLSAAVAGLAGFLWAVKDAYVNPEMLGWHTSGTVLVMLILGGLGSLRGAVLGAAAYLLLKDAFQSQALIGEASKHWQLWMGATVIACVVLMPRGLAGLLDRLAPAPSPDNDTQIEHSSASSGQSGWKPAPDKRDSGAGGSRLHALALEAAPSMLGETPLQAPDKRDSGAGGSRLHALALEAAPSMLGETPLQAPDKRDSGAGGSRLHALALEAAPSMLGETPLQAPDKREASPDDAPLLRAHAITRRFGGLVAVSEVSLALKRGEVHAVIGTNGAGKSTLVNVLAGELLPSSGRVELLGADVTHTAQPQRARAGLGRSYQRSTVFADFTVLENVRLAAQAADPAPWRIGPAAMQDAALLARARTCIAQVGLSDVAQRTASSISHGQRRQLEIAMCLATAPQVLLLDEPLAGMGAEETERMLALLQTLKADHAILLIEHDMDAVFRIADRITVMVEGRVIASDAPAAIRAHPDVQRAYLGEDFHDA
jgi:branched-chain amino acid transport system permease protein